MPDGVGARLHGRQVTGPDRVVLGVMSCLGRVVSVIRMSRLLRAPGWLLGTSLVLASPSFRRVMTVAITWRGGPSAVVDVFSAGAVLFTGLLLRDRLVLSPFAHALRPN
jgi:hypothetical protein